MRSTKARPESLDRLAELAAAGTAAEIGTEPDTAPEVESAPEPAPAPAEAPAPAAAPVETTPAAPAAPVAGDPLASYVESPPATSWEDADDWFPIADYQSLSAAARQSDG